MHAFPYLMLDIQYVCLLSLSMMVTVAVIGFPRARPLIGFDRVAVKVSAPSWRLSSTAETAAVAVVIMAGKVKILPVIAA